MINPAFYLVIPLGLLIIALLLFALWVHRFAPLESKIKYQHLFPTVLPDDFISNEEQQAIERGELKVEPYKKMPAYLLWAILAIYCSLMVLRRYLNNLKENCDLLFGIFPSFIGSMVFFPIVIMVLLFMGYRMFLVYKQSLATGFTVKANRKSRKYRFLIKASGERIHLEYGARVLALAAAIITFGIMFKDSLIRPLTKVEMENYPKTQLLTYQLASGKLQQQCLVKQLK